MALLTLTTSALTLASLGDALGGALALELLKDAKRVGWFFWGRKRFSLWLKQRAINAAVIRALEVFSQKRPAIVSSFFDEHFLTSSAAPELAKLLKRDEEPDSGAIAAAYAKQLPHQKSQTSLQVQSQMQEFLEILQAELKKESSLQTLLNSRQIDQTFEMVEEMHKALRERTSGAADAANSPRLDRDSLKSVSEKFIAASEMLTHWPQTLDGATWLDRPEEESICLRISNPETRLTVLLGPPGSGKSALLSRIANRQIKANKIVLAIKADELPNWVDSIEQLGKHLGIAGDLVEHVRGVAESTPVGIVVDQLDALCELVDVRTDRLNTILNFISQTARLENVWILCSCRALEYKRDSRLRRFDGHSIDLILPSWNQIRPILESVGLKTEGWPDEFRNVLVYPQNLKLFLTHFAAAEQKYVFRSYQHMLDELWELRVSNRGKEPARAQFLLDLASTMADEDALWLPEARYDSQKPNIDLLAEAGILTRSSSSKSIGFAHQTLHDHALARGFAKGDITLHDFVLARQTLLVVRPKIWSALNYLRDVDETRYLNELEVLWKLPTLRSHVRFLLIEFLGSVSDPKDREVMLLRPTFTDAGLYAVACSSVAGKPQWFELIARNGLHSVMQRTGDGASPAVNVLREASAFQPELVLQLMQEHLCRSEEKLLLAWSVLQGFHTWSPTAIELAQQVVKSLDLVPWAIVNLGCAISAKEPTKAPKVVRSALDHLLQSALANRTKVRQRINEQVTDNQGTLSAEDIRAIHWDSKDPVKRIFEDTTGWYQLPAIAEAAPSEFVQEILPWFSESIEFLSPSLYGRINSYKQDNCLGTIASEEEEKREYGLVAALALAIEKWALQDPATFGKYISTWFGSELMAIQRLICFGLEKAAGHLSNEALAYLLGDPRRLSIGNHSDSHLFSNRLITALATNLPPPKREELQELLLATDVYLPDNGLDVQDRQRAIKWRRQHTIQLLNAIPEGVRSEGIQRRLEEERRAFAGNSANIGRPMAGSGSMSSDQMARASIADVQKLFRELPDSTGWGDHWNNKGGSIQASNALGDLAAKNPAKAIEIIEGLDPAFNKRPVARVLSSITKELMGDAAYFELILKFSERGFFDLESIEEIARAMQRRIRPSLGLPDSICDLLLQTLRSYDSESLVEESEPSNVLQPKNEGERQFKSVLWDSNHFDAVPGNGYSIFETLAKGFCRRTPFPSDKFICLLEAEFARTQVAEFWRSACIEVLPRLDRCEVGRAVAFIDRLFDEIPEFAQGYAVVRFLAFAIHWAPERDWERWASAIRNGPWLEGRQAFAELVVLCHAFQPARSWPGIVLSEIADRSSAKSTPTQVEEMRGVAFAAANLWEQGRFKEVATSLIERLCDTTDVSIASALEDLFRVTDPLPQDIFTQRILDALCKYRTLTHARSHGFVVDRLHDILPEEAIRVHSLCIQLIQVFGKQMGDIRTAWAADTGSLISISLTLQRLQEPHRTNGLEMFEAMLRLEAYQIKDALREIDRRVESVAITHPVRRRTRQKHRAGQ